VLAPQINARLCRLPEQREQSEKSGQARLLGCWSIIEKRNWRVTPSAIYDCACHKGDKSA
jgi:hypothetical protein